MSEPTYCPICQHEGNYWTSKITYCRNCGKYFYTKDAVRALDTSDDGSEEVKG